MNAVDAAVYDVDISEVAVEEAAGIEEISAVDIFCNGFVSVTV